MNARATPASSATPAPAPWWRYGHVWLVISGPALVVVASFLTLYLAVTRGDPLVDERYYQSADSVGDQSTKALALAPAMQARNHAATGVLPPAKH